MLGIGHHKHFAVEYAGGFAGYYTLIKFITGRARDGRCTVVVAMGIAVQQIHAVQFRMGLGAFEGDL